MLQTRVIPCLLLKERALVKTVQFGSPNYIGDPINAIRTFNEKEVDELILLDIGVTPRHEGPPLELLSEVTNECFMPLCYGGGIRSLEQVQHILALGVEKVALNTIATEDPSFVEKVARNFGSQSLVVSIDARKSTKGYSVYTNGGTRPTGEEVSVYARKMESLGAGELLLTSIDMDGTMKGFDVPLVQTVMSSVRIPVIVCGGAGHLSDIKSVVHEGKASAVALGSMAVYHGRSRAVLIGFPSRADLMRVLQGAPS